VGGLAVQEVGGHEQFQGDFGSDGKLGDLCGAIGEANLVCEEHADFLKDVRPGNKITNQMKVMSSEMIDFVSQALTEFHES